MAFQGDSIYWVEVDKIVANPFQPRREFDEERLRELAESIRMYGVLQPLTVTRREVMGDNGSFKSEYELIAGERRLRASKLAGLVQVPVIIREGEQSEQEKLELAIIENLQREDLNAVDRALAFRQLSEVFGLSHAQVGKKVGRSREFVSNSIRLLGLPQCMLDALKVGDITEGHGRTLLMLNDRPEEQDTLFRETLLKKLTVRELERIARTIATERVRKKEKIDNELIDLEQQFAETLGTRVSIVKTEFGGRMTIDYFSQEELMDILERMKADAERNDGRKSIADSSSSATAEDILLDDLALTTPIIKTIPPPPVPVVPVPPLIQHEVPETPKLMSDVPQSTSPLVSAVTATPVPHAPSVAEPVRIPSQNISSPNALRDRLAMLLKKPATEAAVGTAPAQQPISRSAVPAPIATNNPVDEPPMQSEKSDDSDLYSINSFTL